MQIRLKLALLVAALLPLACSGGRSAETGTSRAQATTAASDSSLSREGGAPRVVVAVIDTGVNPYHAFYRAGSPIYPEGAPSSVTPEVLAEFGIGERNIIRLTRTGNFLVDFEADRAIWERIRPFEFYWFEGTNVIAQTHQLGDIDGGVIPIMPDAEDDTHGVGTTGAVLLANPDAVVVYVEGNALGSADAHELVFTHPAIDMISTSYGASLALGLLPIPETTNFEFSFEGIVNQGKMHFSSAGNGPGFSPFRAGAGPWWSIGVSGVEEGTSNGRTLISGIFPDFIADFTQELPYCQACEDGYSNVGGTSFSTPRAAGVASKILLEARRAAGHSGGIQHIDGTPFMVASNDVFITNWQLRRAMEEAAYVADIGEYDPVEGVFDIAGIPINPVAPWLQIGWGELSADPAKAVIDEAVAQLGFGQPNRSKDSNFCDHQTGWIQLRKVYWDQLVPGSESNGNAPANDPFEYCSGQFF